MLQSWLNKIKAYYAPVTTNYRTYKEQSIYCEYIHYIDSDVRKLAVSLNVQDKNIYIYYRDKLTLPDKKTLFPNFNLMDKNNILFYRLSDKKPDQMAEIFVSLVEMADKFFLEHPHPHISSKHTIDGNYIDNQGNNIQAPINLKNCFAQILGKNNLIEIDDEAYLYNVTIECRGNNNRIKIGKKKRCRDIGG